jgi:multiple sugar transport system substrate-binding protein
MTASNGFRPVATRRAVLAGAAAATLGLGARRARGETATIRWWSPQASPAQRAAYDFQIAQFEAANPGVKVVFQPTSDEGYAQQLAAAFAAGEVPNVVTHLPSFAVQDYWNAGLLEPLNDVITALGPQNYYDGANRIYEITKGIYAGTGMGNTAANMLWLRRDLMQKAGIDAAPTTWDALRAACKKMMTGGIYGAPLPYGRNSMTSLVFIGVIHQAGGQVFSPELDVAIDSDHTLAALDWYKSMREVCPPGATGYSWGESLNGFVSGACATGIYAGRVLANVTKQNPGIADSVTCTVYPTISADVAPWTFNDFPSVFVPKAAKNMEITKKFVISLFNAEGYIKQLLGAPGHILPVLKPIATNPTYLADPIIKKYSKEVDLMAASAAGGYNLGFESAAHKPNVSGGKVVNSDVIAEMVQRVCVNGENAKAVVGETAKKIAEIMKG